ncbi:unnamed protein product, partial [Staurois parvus]
MGGTSGHRCVTLQSDTGGCTAGHRWSGTGGCTAGHRWVHCWAQVGDLLGTGG